jgi:hypothetical protein
VYTRVALFGAVPLNFDFATLSFHVPSMASAAIAVVPQNSALSRENQNALRYCVQPIRKPTFGKEGCGSIPVVSPDGGATAAVGPGAVIQGNEVAAT